MYDPLSWSFPLGHFFGITVRVHILLPVVALGFVLRSVVKYQVAGTWVDMVMIQGFLFLAVLLHEYGHCLAAHCVDGDPHEILLWPLGGLASVELPHSPQAHLVTAMGGPLVNILLCMVCGSILVLHFSLWPPLHPTEWPRRFNALGSITLYNWTDNQSQEVASLGAIILARFFWVNWVLALLNLLLLGFPLDSGRIFQAILWPFVGYRPAMLTAIFAGFMAMFMVGLYAVVFEETLPLCLALFMYVSCRNEWIMLETGGDDGLFGYDFSQGFTSLERDDPSPPRQRRPSWWQRWWQRRALRKMQRQQEQREYEERRMDELLEKVQQNGLEALTEEERRFLKRVSDRYRNRQ